MYDIVSVLFVLVFFALCVAYTNACDRILGPDEQVAAEAGKVPGVVYSAEGGSRLAPPMP